MDEEANEEFKKTVRDIAVDAGYFDQGDGTVLPSYEKEERLPLFDEGKLSFLNKGSIEQVINIIGESLMMSKTSISDQDKRDLEAIFKEVPQEIKLPQEIPHKETLTFVADLVMRYCPNREMPGIKTATDVLRLAVAMSGGDVSLAETTKFRNFKRKERRYLLGLLEGLLERTNNTKEEMVKYRERWIRLGEKLHPGEYQAKFPKTAEAFHKIRDGEKIPTFASEIEKLLGDKQAEEVTKLLLHRPGEFARRLDHLIRIADSPEYIVEEFSKVTDKVSTPVLLQLSSHFRERARGGNDIRVFFPKGSLSKAYGKENDLPAIEAEIADYIRGICYKALIERFGERDPLGNVYIDPALERYVVPFSQRSASKSLQTIVRGTRLPLDAEGTIRLFCYWKGGGVDVDLTVAVYDENWNYSTHISFTNLTVDNGGCHSGDITSAPNGASEFVDIDVKGMKKQGRYLAMLLYSYSGEYFSEMKECFVGWMERESPQSGEVYEPKTVRNKIDITSQSQNSIPLFIDLEAMEIIWADITMQKMPPFGATIEGSQKGVSLLGRAVTQMEKTNLYTLFTLHALGRGEIVESAEEADIVFSEEGDITPFDIEIISSEYL